MKKRENSITSILSREELMEYLTGAFIAGRDGITLDVPAMKSSCISDFESKIGRSCFENEKALINWLYADIAEMYEEGCQAREVGTA